MIRISKRFTTIATAALTIAAFTFTACRKDKDKDTEDTGYGADHATLEKTFSDAQSITDEAGNNGSVALKGGPVPLSACATVTNDTLSAPHVLTVDFGNTDCLCGDGVYRRGKIIVTYTGRYRDMGHMHTITFDNYFQNYNEVTGTKTVSYTANNSLGQPVYDISVSGSVILANNGGTISWTSQRMRTWTAGNNTQMWNDDEYDITGSGTITRANGKTFTINITTPLHIALNCKWVESGIVAITPQNGNVRTLDYGNGTCDAQANYTANGTTYSITLRH